MNEQLFLQAGNWVSFLRGDQLVYAKVEYLRPAESDDQPETVITTAGEITKGQIVEVRR